MTHLPLLASGAMLQFPIETLRSHRTIVNELPGGGEIKLAVAGAARRRWRLHFTGLTQQECDSLAEFFDAQEGRLKSFCFVDPTENLLGHSEDLASDDWVKEPLLTLTEMQGATQGNGQVWRILNAGGAAQRLSQRIAAPATLPYCFSIWARATSAETQIMVTAAAGAERGARAWILNTAWQLVSVAVQGVDTAETIECALELPGGSSILIAAPQVEAQFVPTEYKRTNRRSGVYPKARFDDDSMSIRAVAPDSLDVSYTIAAVE